MQLTYVLELLTPTKNKSQNIENNILEVYHNRNAIASKLSNGINSLSSKDFDEKLPSAVINQNIREVKALYKLFKRSTSKKDNIAFKKNQPLCFNNQNYKLNEHFISLPLYNEKSSRYWFPLVRNSVFYSLTTHIENGAKLGKSSLFKKNNKYYFAVTIKAEVEKTNCGKNTMGIDVGLNQIAVASVKNNSDIEINRSFYNGKEVGFIRKKYRALRRSLGKAKKTKKIKEIKDKESRYTKNLNHKISRQLVNLAVQEGVSTIVMEDLNGIRKTAYSSKVADKNLNSWSFYELQSFIDYKAKLEGIKVIYINPRHTSQTCNKCKGVNKSNRNKNLYTCSCGSRVHSDLNAARNICDLGIKAVYQQSA